MMLMSLKMGSWWCRLVPLALLMTMMMSVLVVYGFMIILGP